MNLRIIIFFGHRKYDYVRGYDNELCLFKGIFCFSISYVPFPFNSFLFLGLLSFLGSTFRPYNIVFYPIISQLKQPFKTPQNSGLKFVFNIFNFATETAAELKFMPALMIFLNFWVSLFDLKFVITFTPHIIVFSPICCCLKTH